MADRECRLTAGYDRVREVILIQLDSFLLPLRPPQALTFALGILEAVNAALGEGAVSYTADGLEPGPEPKEE